MRQDRWLVVGSVCIGAFMGQVDSSITQLLLPRLELEFNARLSLAAREAQYPQQVRPKNQTGGRQCVGHVDNGGPNKN